MHRNILAWLIQPESAETFERDVWGRTPAIFKASAAREEQFRELFTTETFDVILSNEEHSLAFGVDVLTARYRNGIRERPTAPICDASSVRDLFAEGVTLQLLQPQRFVPEIRRICVSLESEIECLVGCNAYLTPKNTQGLAPHHDDVELFICQTQGAKTWKLYRPLNGFVLPNGPSDDLSQEVIGDPVMEVILEPGDVLYMPKGTVHQALAQETDSVHLTLSSYQRWTWGDVTSTLLQETLMARSEPVCLPVSMREELPLGFLSQVGRYTGGQKRSEVIAQELAKRLRDLADSVEKKTEIVQRTADMMAYEFLTSRMPPNDDEFPAQDQYPKLEDVIQLTGSGLSRLMPVLSDDGTVDESLIQVLTCFSNNPQSHMMVYPEEAVVSTEDMQIDQNVTTAENQNTPGDDDDDEDGSISFPSSKRKALLQIFESGQSGVRVRDLRLQSDDERLDISAILWEHGVVHVLDRTMSD